ncbi:SGNH/GDSL hydrolase family protein [Pedobacter duraquae]|uniref:GDSL-like lipase/acylhydrolase family protein n=1 Tax=Pedobacter duraquae TaxID=425511 RepID=A0A4R6IIE2_9SPHI|nr:G-D-S-L family lipolytic protein [Pedobacter duraquae]TDO21685.1 GDSL-like lipase/acylhydrolase family protein [Pedobacter duraquae]
MNSKHILKSVLAVAFIAGLSSCKPELKDVTPTNGQADFSRYIAIGNSLTSGYADNGLYLEGQKNSYPEMLAAQMKNVGGGNFSTPFFTEAHANGSGYAKLLGLNANGTPNIGAETSNLAVRGQVAIPGFGNVVLYDKYSGDLNNYGVPGIKLAHVNLAAYGNLNGYYERLLPGNAGTNSTTYLDFVMAKPYTFFSMWLGNNDILGYASSGGVGDIPTPKADFAALYAATVNRLVGSKAKGVVATIPDVTTTPYFRTVTLATLLATIRATAAGASVTTLYIQTGAGTRAATAADLFTLTLSSAGVMGVPNGAGLPYGLHPLNPIENKYVLDATEVATVNDFTAAYNATITSVASANGLALMDANTLLKQYNTPTQVNGAVVSSAYITGNLFSLDGIHLTPMGYAITANAFIKAINTKYGSSIPIVDVTKYRGVKFPLNNN